MKRFLLLGVVLVLMTISPVGVGAISAPVDPGIVVADVYVDQGATNPNANTDEFYLSVGSDTLCTSTNATQWAYLRWDLSSWAGKTVDAARIQLTSTLGPLPETYAFTLFKVADDGWDETLMSFSGTAPMTPPPAFNPVTDAIETFTVPVGGTATVVFQSAALATYIGEEAAGDGNASFAFRMTACPGAGGGATAVFDDEENGSKTALAAASSPASPNAITVPYLTVQATTAVQVRTFHAADPAVNWPLVAGVGALAAVLIGGLAVARRRAATH